ncbi:TPA: hypothetical protein N0F65_008905 [Lagenidium giganteum]|uniref:EF-hand domain-containing protein n=1 Tax=Lagenidium giganteum TaxID=4803 RepID=A0AAV2YY10_9STRA|nr:TPA: hypothetical protein N0F65_008905 [Lagenidium giganteum]
MLKHLHGSHSNSEKQPTQRLRPQRGSLGSLTESQARTAPRQPQRGSVGGLSTRDSIASASTNSPRLRGSLGDLRKPAGSELPAINTKMSPDRKLSTASSPRGARGSIVGTVESAPPPQVLVQVSPEELQAIRQQLQQTTKKMDLISRAESTKLTTFDETKMGVSIRSRSSAKQLANGADAMSATIDERQRAASTGEIAIPGLDKAIRRASLTCRQSLDEKDKSAGNSRTDMESYFRLQKRSVFGLYSVREVMGVIRLFHVLDEDNSNTVSLSELQHIRPFFERIGQYDLSKVFHVIDKDSNGQISLRELLESCFPHASSAQVDEMLRLAKVGNVRQFFGGATDADASSTDTSGLTQAHRQELLDIFRIFDKNGDGFVCMDEIMQALHIDDNEHEMERFVAEQRHDKAVAEKGGSGSNVAVTATGNAPRRAGCSSGITRKDMERYYAEYDVNGDEVLDFDEFVELMLHDHHANKAHGQPVTFDSSSKSIDDIELGEVERAQRLEKLKQRAALLVSDDSTDSLDISPTKWAQTSPRRKQRAHRIVATKADELEREELVRQRRQTLATSIALSVNSHTVVHPVVAADATATAAAAMPLGEVFRRVSLAHEKHRPPDTTTRVLDTTHQLLAAARFGVYRAHEVMAVIRFFWYLDEDRSGTISLPELHSIKLALVAAGYDDMAAVFLAIDHDSNGSISLRELLELCFHRATKTQIKEMLTLAKLGDLPAYLTHLGYHSPKQPRPREDPEEAEHRKEMMEIFRVFDTDNDGTVSVDEIMETLRVDDDDVVAKFMATERETRKRSLSVEAWKSATSGIKRDDIEKFYAECDLDHNRLLNFDEFVEFLGAYYRPLLPMIMGVPDKHSPPKSGYTASTTHTKLKETQNLVTANLFI